MKASKNQCHSKAGQSNRSIAYQDPRFINTIVTSVDSVSSQEPILKL